MKVSVKLVLSMRGKPAIASCQPSHLLEASAHRLSLQLNLRCQEQLVAFEGREKKQEANASLQQWKDPQDPHQRKYCFKRTSVALMSPKLTSPNHEGLMTPFKRLPLLRH